jgi:hypothetical protein
MNHQVVGFGLFATGPAQAQLVAVAAGEVAAVAGAAKVEAVSTFCFMARAAADCFALTFASD